MRTYGFIVVATVVACSHPHSSDPIATPEAPRPVDDEFSPPSPLVLGPATPVAAQCLPAANDPGAYESGRLTAALDRELRRQGGMLLPEGTGDGAHKPIGAIIDAGNGRAMVVGSRSCGQDVVASIGLDATGAVFEVTPRYHAAEHRKIAVCELNCHFGCGANMPPTEIVVAIPVNAHWAGSRVIDVPIDVEVEETFPATATCGPGPP